jgi:hypothetical protein
MVPENMEKLPWISEMSVKHDPQSLSGVKMRRSLSGSHLDSIVTDDCPLPGAVTSSTNTPPSGGVILSISRVLDEVVFDPQFQYSASPIEKQMADSATDLKYFGGIDGVLRITKVISFFSCPLFLMLSLREMRAESQPLLASVYGVIGFDSLRISYNCYVKNYCAVSYRR